jgi:hypothetical protein
MAILITRWLDVCARQDTATTDIEMNSSYSDASKLQIPSWSRLAGCQPPEKVGIQKAKNIAQSKQRMDSKSLHNTQMTKFGPFIEAWQSKP